MIKSSWPDGPSMKRIRLVSRLDAAIIHLRNSANYESAAAVAEALEVIRALPYGEAINRALYPDYSDHFSKKSE